MNAGIFIKSYKGDAPWLEYCLKSIKKFCKSYGQVLVASEDKEIGQIADYHGAIFRPVNKFTGDGYIHQQVIKLIADHFFHPSTEYIVYWDSDCMAIREHTPEFWFKDGKPIMMVTPYSSLPAPPAMPWKSVTEEIMKFECPFETMRRHPMVIPRGLLPEIREYLTTIHRKKWSDYLLSRPYRSCSEFNMIGSYILKFHPEIVTVVNTDKDPLPPNALKQFWSWGGITPKIKTEIEGILK